MSHPADAYLYDESDKCGYDIEWEFNHTLLLIIQKTTGKMTHEILNVVVTELDKMNASLGFNLESKKSGAVWQLDPWAGWQGRPENRYIWYSTNRRRNKILTYPGTDITFNLQMTCAYSGSEGYRHMWKDGKWVSTKIPMNTNHVKVKVDLPNKKLKFSTSDVSNILAEADILDESSDLEQVELKSSPTLEEKKQKRSRPKQTREESK